MHDSAEQESEECRLHLREMEERDRRVVDVPKQKVVDGSVPVASVLVERYGVPPCAVEAAVGKSCNLCQHIEKTLPYHVPGEELFEEKGKEHVGYC